MAKYPDGSIIMDQHVTAEHVAELAEQVEQLRGFVQGVANAGFPVPAWMSASARDLLSDIAPPTGTAN